jgi:hypothetical protein
MYFHGFCLVSGEGFLLICNRLRRPCSKEWFCCPTGNLGLRRTSHTLSVAQNYARQSHLSSLIIKEIFLLCQIKYEVTSFRSRELFGFVRPREPQGFSPGMARATAGSNFLPTAIPAFAVYLRAGVRPALPVPP